MSAPASKRRKKAPTARTEAKVQPQCASPVHQMYDINSSFLASLCRTLQLQNPGIHARRKSGFPLYWPASRTCLLCDSLHTWCICRQLFATSRHQERILCSTQTKYYAFCVSMRWTACPWRLRSSCRLEETVRSLTHLAERQHTNQQTIRWTELPETHLRRVDLAFWRVHGGSAQVPWSCS